MTYRAPPSCSISWLLVTHWDNFWHEWFWLSLAWRSHPNISSYPRLLSSTDVGLLPASLTELERASRVIYLSPLARG